MSSDISKNIIWPGWETVRLIGRGSFGAVYEIQREVFGETEKAALKVISIPQNESDIDDMLSDGHDEESITKIIAGHMKSVVAEYTLMRKMTGCTNIVNCEDIRCVQRDDGMVWDLFIKMELLTPLTKALDQNVPEETVIKIAKDLCNALVVCKQHNIIHRDIKPQNIFVSAYGDYKLGDFGIAKTVEKTMGGTKAGTYKYMAPEVYNNQAYGSTADIYSLGLVLYWLLNERRLPFLPLPPAKIGAGMEEEARYRRLSGEALPLPRHGSRELKAIVMKACAYDTRERFRSASEMLDALNNMRQDSHIKVYQEKTNDDLTIVEEVDVNQNEDMLETVSADRKNRNNKTKTKKIWQLSKKKIGALFVAIGTVAVVVAIALGVPAIKKASIKILDVSATARLNISAGDYTVVALKDNGMVKANGVSYFGECNVQSWTDIVKVSAGSYHTIGLKNDGTVVSAGNNLDGERKVNSWKEITDISAGDGFTIGLKNDGTVVATGANISGECDVQDWKEIVAVSAGWRHTAGLKSDGTVVATGFNNNSRCNVQDWEDIVAIDAGALHTVGLKSDGTVVATGSNYEGESNVQNWKNIIAVAAGAYYTVGLKADGTVVAVGDNAYGQCDVRGWKNIVAIYASSSTIHPFTLGVMADGSVAIATEDEGIREQIESVL